MNVVSVPNLATGFSPGRLFQISISRLLSGPNGVGNVYFGKQGSHLGVADVFTKCPKLELAHVCTKGPIKEVKPSLKNNFLFGSANGNRTRI
jgi:hypothetical protein